MRHVLSMKFKEILASVVDFGRAYSGPILKYLGLILLLVGLGTIFLARSLKPEFGLIEYTKLGQEFLDAGSLDILDLDLYDLDSASLKEIMEKTLGVSLDKALEYKEAIKPYLIAENIGRGLATLGTVFLVLYFFSYYNDIFIIRESRFKPPELDFDELEQTELLRMTVLSLLERAHNMRNQARFFMLLIVLLCSGGLALFYYAGEIAAKEYDYELSEFLEEASEDIDRKVDQLSYGFDDISDKLADGEIDPLTAEALLKVDSEKFSLNVAALKDIPVQIGLQVIESKDRLISTVATRLGAIFIVIFLVRIFSSSYRYSLRLSSFYSSRADALTIAARNCPSDLDQLIKSLGPDWVDFEGDGEKVGSRILDMIQRKSSGDGGEA